MFLQNKNQKSVRLSLNSHGVALNSIFFLVSDLKTGKYAREMLHLIQQYFIRLFGSNFLIQLKSFG